MQRQHDASMNAARHSAMLLFTESPAYSKAFSAILPPGKTGMWMARTVYVFVGLLLLSGCRLFGSETPLLRIKNGGSTPIVNLTVLFPEDSISFGDIAPGAITTYRNAPDGVYRYAAYSFEIDGTLVIQPVIDWVGEEPLGSGSFTYTLEVLQVESQSWFIALLEVS